MQGASPSLPRVVITGVGLTAPNGNDLETFRHNLLNGVSGIRTIEAKYMGPVPAGQCDFDELRYQGRKARRRGTRAGSLAIYCAHEALAGARLDLADIDPARVGVYVGITEHGSVEMEREMATLRDYGDDTRYWSHHHNPRTVANNPAGEVTIALGLTGPHYTLGGACAAGNLGLIQGVQMLQMGTIDQALGGGVSEAVQSFGIFASFKAEGALASHEDPTRASRPFDMRRNGIVVSEGGCLLCLERLDDARARGAPILAEVAGYAVNSDGHDFVLPLAERQVECIRIALAAANLDAGDVDIVNAHATATIQGDVQECQALRSVFGGQPGVRINNTKSFIGHTMGAAGALELAGNLPAFDDGRVHPTINVEELDPECALDGLVLDTPVELPEVECILNNSFGMLGINSCVIVKRSPSGADIPHGEEHA